MPEVRARVAQVLAHLGRPGGAVEPDEIDAQRGERRQGGADLRAEQHGAGGLDGDLGEHRQFDPGRAQRTTRPHDGRLGLQQVLRGLDQDGVRAAGHEAGDLLLVGVAQHGVRGVAQARQLRPGTDRAEHPALMPGCRPVVGDAAGDRRPGLGQLEDAVGDPVLAQVGEVGAEGVRLDAVDTHGEVRVVHAGHELGPGDVEDLVAALVALEVVEARVGGLEHGAHRAVRDDDASGQGLAQRATAVGGMRSRRRSHDRQAYPSLGRVLVGALRWSDDRAAPRHRRGRSRRGRSR